MSSTVVKMGTRELVMNGPYMTELRESNDILDDEAALRRRLKEDGYLFIRGFHDRTKVQQARLAYLQRIAEQGKLMLGTAIEEGIINSHNKGAAFLGSENQPPELLEVVNSESTMQFFNRFLGGPSLTYDYKWVRAVGTGDFTGAHYDIVYMGRGTKNLYTLWTPLDDISYELGGLAILLGSQHFDRVRETYGQMDVDRDRVDGWFADDPLELIEKFGGQWATAEFRAGDALIFGMYTMHGSLTNQTNRYRFSADTRYQLQSEPVDERWIGAKPKGHYGWHAGPTISMEEARTKWGV
ncbi:phytanoyl-CoA dioxygenase family protein [Paenibacillus sp. OV219]|uniref:phytanoyl-CoA dioxygenase family protein n=1 Tax=Paenibacillus sp. OV219 TaxID=1884377 RepID=UPI0008BA4CA2|nr:phytanoyl-CoA dioxygenase family protein [Paenibacillus sp. OV219]SEM73861.1 Phytanoyl-CoA dioxygenase (PhyH) [Paenibacillus sp. OV219]